MALFATFLCLLITCLTSVNGRRVQFQTENELFADKEICMSSIVGSNNVQLWVVYFDYKLKTWLIEIYLFRLPCQKASDWTIEAGNIARILVSRDLFLCLIADHRQLYLFSTLKCKIYDHSLFSNGLSDDRALLRRLKYAAV